MSGRSKGYYNKIKEILVRNILKCIYIVLPSQIWLNTLQTKLCKNNNYNKIFINKCDKLLFNEHFPIYQILI